MKESVFSKARKLAHKDLEPMRNIIFERVEKEMTVRKCDHGPDSTCVFCLPEKEKAKEKSAIFEGLNTNLISKQYSPLTIRKCNIAEGWPVYIGIICDYSLSDLDSVINKCTEEAKQLGYLSNDIQKIRNFAGFLTDSIQKHYNALKINCVEGVAVFIYVDKCAVSSLYGDFMNHGQCRAEFYSILNMLPHI